MKCRPTESVFDHDWLHEMFMANHLGYTPLDWKRLLESDLLDDDQLFFVISDNEEPAGRATFHFLMTLAAGRTADAYAIARMFNARFIECACGAPQFLNPTARRRHCDECRAIRIARGFVPSKS